MRVNRQAATPGTQWRVSFGRGHTHKKLNVFALRNVSQPQSASSSEDCWRQRTGTNRVVTHDCPGLEEDKATTNEAQLSRTARNPPETDWVCFQQMPSHLK